MRRVTRRGALATGAATVAALAGCSSLPFTGSESSSLPSYDALTLADAIHDGTVDAPETYPAPVPGSLLETHRERALDLLDDVPETPSFPNEAVADRLRNQRERAVERRPETTPADPTLEDVTDWRYARSDAAEVAFAYRAAAGDLTASDVDSRRLDVRDDYRTARGEVTYRGDDPVDALAVGFELESGLSDVRRSLSPDRVFPESPRADSFRAGEVAAGVEEASAHLDTVVGLRDAHRSDDMGDHWNDVAVAAGRLAEVRRATTERAAPFRFDDPDARDVVDGADEPAVELLRLGLVAAANSEDSATNALGQSDYAAAVVYSARAIVDTLATGRAADAIRDGDYDVPADAAAVESEREAAVRAFREATPATPSLLTALVAAPAFRRFQGADDALVEDPSDRTVVRESARYAYVAHAADAVPNVVDRVARELGVDAE